MKKSMGNLVIIRLLKLIYILGVTAIFYAYWQMFYMPSLQLTGVTCGIAIGILYLIVFVLLIFLLSCAYFINLSACCVQYIHAFIVSCWKMERINSTSQNEKAP